MIWWYLIIFIIALLAAVSMIPKPQTAPPPGFGDIKAPTAEEGREIPVLFGTRDMEGPNVVWDGDFRSVAVKSKGGKK
jgi:hypothetical protein